MSTKRKVIVGVVIAAIVFIGLGLLGWGEAIYRRSEGERGWSLGAAAYELLGWDADAYLSDFRRSELDADQLEVEWVDDDGDGLPDRGLVPAPAETSRTWGLGRDKHSDRGFGPAGGLRGLARLTLLGLLIGLGVVWYRRRRQPAASQ